MGEPTTDTLDQRHGKPIDRRALALIAELRHSGVRPSPHRACERVLGDLIDLQFEYARKLGTGWDWLEAHRHHPDYDAREDRWLEWLATYEATADAIRTYGPTPKGVDDLVDGALPRSLERASAPQRSATPTRAISTTSAVARRTSTASVGASS
jgi:hypothetical protein